MKKIVVIASMMLFGFINANAAGTLAGTVVTNSASLSYSVGGTAITAPVISNNDVFVVDDKVDLTVDHKDVAAVPVTPGSTDNAAEFLVTNTGNKVHDFLLTSNQNDGDPFGETDTIDATITDIFVESGATPGYQPSEDTATFIDELDPDGTATVYVVSTIPNGAANDDVADVTLTAQVAVGGTASSQGAAIATDDRGVADTAGAVAGDEQIVFADGVGRNGATDGALDGKNGDTSAYKVKTATLSVVKTSCVVSDSITTTGNDKRIPGAVIRYAFEVSNTGNDDAESVVLTDDITGTPTGSHDVFTDAATNLFIDSGTCNCANGGSTAAGGTSGYSSPNVTLDFETVALDTTECGYFEVTIK